MLILSLICKTTKPIITEIVIPIGFKSRGYTFYKLNNDFVQGFKIYALNYHCSIRFFTFPLCGAIDSKYEDDDISLFWGKWSEFIYVESLSENESLKVSKQLVALLKKYLLPWFEVNDTLEKAYQADLDLISSAYLSQMEKTADSRQIAFNKAILHHPMKFFYWMMQMGNYKKAVEFLNIKIHELDDYEKLQDCKIEYLEEFKNMSKKIAEENTTYIKEFMSKQEKITLDNLKFKH
jgi:hypothetical protein